MTGIVVSDSSAVPGNPQVWDREVLAAEAEAALAAGGHPSGRFLNGRIVSVMRSPHLSSALDVAVGFSAIPPGRSTEAHNHVAEEIAFIVSGEGYVQIGEDRFEVSPGTTIFTPSDMVHQTTATGSQPLVSTWVYAPAGSELRWLSPRDAE